MQVSQHAQKMLKNRASVLALEDIDAPLITAFLDDLDPFRRVKARTRNLRLTAVHSFFRYAAFKAPATSAQIQRVLANPAKRFTRELVPFLSRPEVDALLAAPDRPALINAVSSTRFHIAQAQRAGLVPTNAYQYDLQRKVQPLDYAALRRTAS